MKNIINNIYCVGVTDWNVRNFHGYHTDNGSSYNSYLIVGKENILIDSVKYPFKDKLIKNIKECIGEKKLNYIICNHAEPDHSSSIPYIIKEYPNINVICNEKCKSILSSYYETSLWNFKIVKDGEELKIDDNNLFFYNTPMVHWPESMVTYLANEKVLFSMDIFGQHYASSFTFDEEESLSTLLYEAQKYYANIVMPYASQVLVTLEKLKNLDVKIVANSHGLILKKYLPQMIELYTNFAKGINKNKALVIYDSMWGSTEKMAFSLIDGLKTNHNLKIKVCDLKVTDITKVASEAIDAKIIAVGSPTLNSNILPTVAKCLCYLEGLKPKNKTCFCFGSYGWAPICVKKIQEYFENLKWNNFCEPITSQFKPTDNILKDCFNVGEKLSNI